jgi:putative transposase
MLLAHKIELNPNNKQKTYFAKASGTARKAYNWGLSEWQKEHHAGGSPSEAALRRKLNSIKRKEFPWMLEVTKNAPQMAIIQLGQAFKNFFAGRAKYPTVRKKWIDDRFTLSNDQFVVKGKRIRVPHLGWVKLREPLRFEGKIMSAAVSRVADKWVVSITVDTPGPLKKTANDNQVAVGVDLGISSFATLSTGEKITGPKPYKAKIDRIRRLSRSLSRKKKGSKNRHKAKLKLSRLHYQIANVRRNAIHQLTTKLAENYSIIGIEDLNVKGMMRNRRLSFSLSDMGFYEFRRQLEYKAKMHSIIVVTADRWFASSKLCSACDYKLEGLDLSVREWTCPQCKVRHDRDINAAKNLEKMAVSSTVSVCGASSGGAVTFVIVSHGASKQKSNIKVNYS